jgi:Ran GTPase-activating protein (RanGAP) involved in mRNA processing and transport
MELILSGNKITEIDSDFYELFNWLKVIEISDNPLSQSGIIRIFQGSENNRLFKNLKFKYNSDDEYHFKCFNKNLKNIDLSFNRNINISLMKHILSLKYLSQLNLQIDNITDEVLQKIVNLIIENNTPIKDLKLNNNKITSEGSKHISELIKNCKTLNILDLSYNDLKSEGVKNICNTIISSNTDLKQLILNGNKCNDYCSDAIFNMLANSKKLLILSLCGNFFTNKGIDKILSSLRKNNTLKQ